MSNPTISQSSRLLVIDDEAAIRNMLEVGLQRAGFTVCGLPDGQQVIEMIDDYAPDLIILDVMLPGADGFTLLPSMRQATEVPIIMLSAKAETEEKIAGLTRGADDYIAKPFELPELIARVHSALRRPQLGQGETLRYADLMLNVGRRSVFRGSRKVNLSTREFDLLMTLMQQPELVLSRTQLLDLVWGYNNEVFPNTLETYISYLRAKIDSGESIKLIRTLRGRGYMLSAQSE
jgi:DNA-binding response OmpR family regulator